MFINNFFVDHTCKINSQHVYKSNGHDIIHTHLMTTWPFIDWGATYKYIYTYINNDDDDDGKWCPVWMVNDYMMMMMMRGMFKLSRWDTMGPLVQYMIVSRVWVLIRDSFFIYFFLYTHEHACDIWFVPRYKQNGFFLDCF